MHKYNYHIYGLRLLSNIHIPGLTIINETNSSKHILLNMGSFPKFISSLIKNNFDDQCIYKNTSSLNLSVYTLDNEKYYYFKYSEGIEFVCTRDGLKVWITWEEPYTVKDATSYLLGVVLGFILRLQDVVCLHASAVALNHYSIAFAGDSGAGKSTIASALMNNGFKLITEDILPLNSVGDSFLSIPGYPHLRLFADAFQKLDNLTNDSSLISDTWDKHFVDLTKTENSFITHPVPLKTIYILDWEYSDSLQSPSIKKVHPTHAVPLLASQSWANTLLSISHKKNEFIFLSQLATEVDVKRILMCDNLDKLPELVQLIMKDTETYKDKG